MGWIRGMVMAHFALVLAKTNGCHKTGKYLIVCPCRESEKCKMANLFLDQSIGIDDTNTFQLTFFI